jgi:hypothetical protein
MLVLSRAVASRDYNCCTDGSVSPGNYGYMLVLIYCKCFHLNTEAVRGNIYSICGLLKETICSSEYTAALVGRPENNWKDCRRKRSQTLELLNMVQANHCTTRFDQQQDSSVFVRQVLSNLITSLRSTAVIFSSDILKYATETGISKEKVMRLSKVRILRLVGTVCGIDLYWCMSTKFDMRASCRAYCVENVGPIH